MEEYENLLPSAQSGHIQREREGADQRPFVFNLQLTYDSSGNLILTASGIIEQIPLPDGSLFFSAGRVVFTALAASSAILAAGVAACRLRASVARWRRVRSRRNRA